MINAGNKIRRKPYDWGGGHADFKDKGYDCSGAVSYVLHAAGMLDYPMVSGQFMKYGSPGTSRWVSIYASKTHVFMEIAGLRYDTSYITDGDKSGPGWSEVLRERKGFRVRRPAQAPKSRVRHPSWFGSHGERDHPRRPPGRRDHQSRQGALPEAEVTKLDLARHYEAVAEAMLPHVRDRPIAMRGSRGGSTATATT